MDLERPSCEFKPHFPIQYENFTMVYFSDRLKVVVICDASSSLTVEKWSFKPMKYEWEAGFFVTVQRKYIHEPCNYINIQKMLKINLV